MGLQGVAKKKPVGEFDHPEEQNEGCEVLQAFPV